MSQNRNPAQSAMPGAESDDKRTEARPLPEPISVIGSRKASPAELADQWLARRRERRKYTYLRRTLLDHYNIAMLTAVAVSSMISGSLWVLLAGLIAEIAVLAVVPHLGLFRRKIDEHLAMLEQAEIGKEREQLLLQMNEEHREQFERLEYLVERVRYARDADAAAGALHQELGLDRLLGTYVELAITHRRGHQFLAMTSRRQLERELHVLRSRAAEPAASQRIRRLQRHRIAIAQKRLERWDRNREHLDVVGHQLATISELIQLVHEHSMTPMSTRAIAEEIDKLLGEVDESDGILRELAEACGDVSPSSDADAPADEHAGEIETGEAASGETSWREKPSNGWYLDGLKRRLAPVQFRGEARLSPAEPCSRSSSSRAG